jgi:hypothetical protein
MAVAAAPVETGASGAYMASAMGVPGVTVVNVVDLAATAAWAAAVAAAPGATVSVSTGSELPVSSPTFQHATSGIFIRERVDAVEREARL